MSIRTKTKRGDTLIEVLLATAIFSIIAVSSVGIMNHGLSKTQAALETTMARTEIDTQAEALRYIHDAYATDRTTNTLWEAVVDESLAYDAIEIEQLKADIADCSSAYSTQPDTKAFIIDTKHLTSLKKDDATNSIKTSFDVAPITPRIAYSGGNFEKAEGLWVVSVESSELAKDENDSDVPQYYDFYIQTCWNTPGSNTPTNLSTTIRLHNPLAIANITSNEDDEGDEDDEDEEPQYCVSYVFDEMEKRSIMHDDDEKRNDFIYYLQRTIEGGEAIDKGVEKCYSDSDFDGNGYLRLFWPNKAVAGFKFKGWTETNGIYDIAAVNTISKEKLSTGSTKKVYAYWVANIESLDAVLSYQKEYNFWRAKNKILDAYVYDGSSWAGFEKTGLLSYKYRDIRNASGGPVAKLLWKNDPDFAENFSRIYGGEGEDDESMGGFVGAKAHRIAKLRVQTGSFLGIPIRATAAVGSDMAMNYLDRNKTYSYSVYNFNNGAFDFDGNEEVVLLLNLQGGSSKAYSIPISRTSNTCQRVFMIKHDSVYDPVLDLTDETREIKRVNSSTDFDAGTCATYSDANGNDIRLRSL